MTDYDPIHDTTVTVYTKNNCMQCKLSKDYLTREGIRYNEYNVEEDEMAREAVVGLGYQQLPVIVSGFDHWSGLRPDKLANIPR